MISVDSAGTEESMALIGFIQLFSIEERYSLFNLGVCLFVRSPSLFTHAAYFEIV